MHLGEDAESGRRLLGAFVRAHRERLTPAEAGLPVGGRRRTAGLRREEIAHLSGLSTTWITWIEQGRPVSMSAAALSRLAAALRLDAAGRTYLFTLAGRRDPAEAAAPSPAEPPIELTAAVAALSVPAYGLDPAWNRCAWNTAAARLFADWLEGPEPNLLRYIYLDPGARRLILDWEDRARRVLAEFRADFSRRLYDPAMRALVEGLAHDSEAFARWWGEQAVMAREGGLRRFDHPDDGLVAFRQHSFSPAAQPDYKLVMLVPE
jgi:transcriptional regulator with XRE-family HTH domain